MEFPTLPLSDPVSAFAVVIILLLIVPIITGKLKIPSIVGLLLAGLAIGPSLLGLVERKGIIELLGATGAVYAMFLAGVEIDLGPLRKNRGQGMSFGAATFAVPFAVGFCAAYFLLGMKLPAALLLGAVLASHSLLSYPQADRLGLRRSRPAMSAATGTIIADSLGLVTLAIVDAQSQLGGKPLALGVMALVLAALILFGLFLLPRISGFFFRKLQPDGTIEFVYAMAALFLFAACARLAGIDPIIGAFIAGLALNTTIPEKSALMNRINFVGNSIFIPFFLISAGMLVDVRAFAIQDGAVIAAIVMVIAAPAAKYLAAAGFRISHRYSANEANLMFGLSVNHAAAALALAMSAFALHLFGTTELGGVVAMILVTCVMGPAVTQSSGRKLVLEAKAATGGEGEANDRIMVLVSNPERTRLLMDLAFTLRPKDSGDPVYPINIVQDSPEVERDSASSEKLLAQTVVHGVASGVNVIPVTRLSYNVSEGVVQAAQEVRASTIIAGSGPGSSFQKRPYGRVIDQIVRSSRQMCIIDRLPKPVALYNSIIAVAPPLCERQHGFRQAAAAIKSLALDCSAKLTLVTLAHGGAALGAQFTASKPQAPFHTLLLDDWREIAGATRKLAGPSAFYALLNVRQGSLAWQPAVDRIPDDILSDNPDAGILCLYLPEDERSAADETESAPEGSLFGAALAKDRVLVWNEPRPMADAIRALLSTAFSKNRALHAKLSGAFSEIAQKEPVELKPGIVLLHSHVADVEEQSIFFGLSVPGIPLLSLQQPVRILVVLIAPESSPPEEHLKTLAKLAALVMNSAFADKLLAVRSAADLDGLEGSDTER
jgi:Kef-type K+ transport system membrane component KefB/mannitol/fructose-specific phosphotransferase system IIA component (Ntr-type)